VAHRLAASLILGVVVIAAVRVFSHRGAPDRLAPQPAPGLRLVRG
jgi:hypothetical protein